MHNVKYLQCSQIRKPVQVLDAPSVSLRHGEVMKVEGCEAGEGGDGRGEDAGGPLRLEVNFCDASILAACDSLPVATCRGLPPVAGPRRYGEGRLEGEEGKQLGRGEADGSGGLLLDRPKEDVAGEVVRATKNGVRVIDCFGGYYFTRQALLGVKLTTYGSGHAVGNLCSLKGRTERDGSCEKEQAGEHAKEAPAVRHNL